MTREENWLTFAFCMLVNLASTSADEITLTRLGSEDILSSSMYVTVSGKVAYVCGGFGLSISEISNPLQPRALGWTHLSGPCVAVSGRYAYLGGGNPENGPDISVIDVSDPADPRLLTTSQAPPLGAVWDITLLEGNFVYLATGNGVRVYGVADPTQPPAVVVSQVGPPSGGGGATFMASGHYLYLANGYDGLRVFEISNLAAPEMVGHLANSPGSRAFTYQVALSAGYAYVANGGAGLMIYDVSNPTTPQDIGYRSSRGWVGAVHVGGNYAYVDESAS